MNKSDVIQSVRIWIESFIVEHSICPFAKHVLVNDGIHFVVTEADTEEDLLVALQAELGFLAKNESVETSLLIHPNVLQDFYDYNEFLNYADKLLVEMQFEGVFQIASFHPNYQFSGTEPDDVENYTNKSNYPMLHVLRESSVDKAVENYPDTDQIPLRNIKLMNRMGRDNLNEILQACIKKK